MANFPVGIGPHEGNEVDLMRRGEKHVAMFDGYEPEGLEELLADGGFGCFTDRRRLLDFSHDVLFVFRDGHEAAARRLCAITRDPPKGFQPDHEHEVGRILGYSPEQVEAFLAHVGSRT